MRAAKDDRSRKVGGGGAADAQVPRAVHNRRGIQQERAAMEVNRGIGEHVDFRHRVARGHRSSAVTQTERA